MRGSRCRSFWRPALFLVASSAKDTEAKAPARQTRHQPASKPFPSRDRIIALIVMAALALVNRDYAAILAFVVKNWFLGSLGLGKFLQSFCSCERVPQIRRVILPLFFSDKPYHTFFDSVFFCRFATSTVKICASRPLPRHSIREYIRFCLAFKIDQVTKF